MTKNDWMEVIGETTMCIGAAMLGGVIAGIITKPKEASYSGYQRVCELYHELLLTAYEKIDTLSEKKEA